MNYGDSRLPDRFWSKCAPEPNSGCWLWFGAQSSAGYGQTWRNGRLDYAHRVAYEALVGTVDATLELDHRVCQLPCCCNPLHLEPVTHAENIRRGYRRKHTIVTSCPHGHALDDDNTYLRRRGVWVERVCRACKRQRYHDKRDRAA